MPVLIGWLGALLETKLGQWVIQILLTLGISFVTYKVGVAPFRDLIMSSFSAMPAMFANILGYMWVDRAISMILSAAVAKEATKGMSAVLTKKGATT